MDPVVAFTLAGTVFQFLEAGAKFVVLAWDLYRGDPDNVDPKDAKNYANLTRITESLDSILPELKTAKRDGKTETSLSQLAEQCEKTAARLLDILWKVKKPITGRKREILKVAFRRFCKEGEIKLLQDQLSAFRSQLNLHLLLSLRRHVSESTEQQEETLRQLGALHDHTSRIDGVAASILEHVISNSANRPQYAGDVKSLNQSLIGTYLQTRADENGLPPDRIHLFPAARERAQSLLLESLQYEEIAHRETRIATAHASTFQWILRDADSLDGPARTIKWANFRHWLESEDQIYWITGKPGSGKSTLMKYLCCRLTETSPADGAFVTLKDSMKRAQTRSHPHLEKWASPSGLVIASFYFWNSGTAQQMTKSGLLRTLLYQILAQRPDLSPAVAIKDWESLCLLGHCNGDWSDQDLQDMLLRAVRTLIADSKICFFIDGLDEFGHDHKALVSLVKTFVEIHRRIKLCVASRPWNIFQDALGHLPNLRLEDLTFEDIKRYVRSRFISDTRFAKLQRRYPQDSDQLMYNVVAKASGVFLWVSLVVEFLLEGVQEGDKVLDLQRRLDDLPADLGNLYDKILHSLDQFYLEQGAQYFTLLETAGEPLSVLQFSFADEESPESAIGMCPGALSDEQILLRVDDLCRRLDSRCKGFLEVDRSMPIIDRHHERQPWQLKVQYLHRTVKDFIKSPKAQQFIQSCQSPNFDSSLQVFVAYLMDVKTWHFRLEERNMLITDYAKSSHLAEYISRCVRQAARVKSPNEGAIIKLLDDLKNFTADILPIRENANFHLLRDRLCSGRNDWTLNLIQYNSVGDLFLCLAVRQNVLHYVKAQSCKRAGILRLLLVQAVSQGVPEPVMIEYLLDLGADPNYEFTQLNFVTPWLMVLENAHRFKTRLSDAGRQEELTSLGETWRVTLDLMQSRGAHCTKQQDSVLPAKSKDILREFKCDPETTPQMSAHGENARKRQLLPDRWRWFRAWKPGRDRVN